MDDVAVMFNELIGEMDHLSQSLMPADQTPEEDLQKGSTFSIGFTDLNAESLNELEDNDLDALVADLGSKVSQQQLSACHQNPTPGSSAGIEKCEPQTKADKIKLALEKLKEAKVRKMIVRVLMADGSSKILMVDERQTVRDVMDKLFEKTHCDCSIDWSLCETNPELQIERSFEDHEYLVEPLSVWSRYSENTIGFMLRPQKYMMFTDPQLFYMWKKKESSLSGVSQQAKELLRKENFEGCTVIVPDLDGMLYLKEDGKKVWRPRHFVLRASGLYYVPKGKTKRSHQEIVQKIKPQSKNLSCSDLACFSRFENVNVYVAHNYRQKYRAPTNFCFILKHPCIQKESHYTKFLCCDEKHSLCLWVNSIRIAKYGAVLYKSYQAALKRASSRQTSPISAATSQVEPSPSTITNVEDYPYEAPPDFIPPPPPHGPTEV